ncbi:hypothetical protein SLS62_011224, partial [Diatrype stigma]
MDLDPIDVPDAISLDDSVTPTKGDCNHDRMDIEPPDLDFTPSFGAGLVLPTFKLRSAAQPQAPADISMTNVNWWEPPAPAPAPMDVDFMDMDSDSDTNQAFVLQGNRNPFKFEGILLPVKPEPIFDFSLLPTNWAFRSQGHGYTYQDWYALANIARGKERARISAATGSQNS